MRKKASRLFFVLVAVAGILTSPVFADLGLARLAAQPQGPQAVGDAVLAAAKAVYANSTDPAVIKSQLSAILNEAVATGNETAVRYAIVAVLVAGGVENLALGRSAINGSDVFAKYPALTATTVAETEALLKATGGSADSKTGGDKIGGDKAGGDKAGGGKEQLGGGDPTLYPFNWGSLTGPGDNDTPATRI